MDLILQKAAIRALERATPGKQLDIRTDSRYLIKGIYHQRILEAPLVLTCLGVTQWVPKWNRNHWVTSHGKDVENRDLFEHLSHLASNFKPAVHWVSTLTICFFVCCCSSATLGTKRLFQSTLYGWNYRNPPSIVLMFRFTFLRTLGSPATRKQTSWPRQVRFSVRRPSPHRSQRPKLDAHSSRSQALL